MLNAEANDEAGALSGIDAAYPRCTLSGWYHCSSLQLTVNTAPRLDLISKIAMHSRSLLHGNGRGEVTFSKSLPLWGETFTRDYRKPEQG